MPIISATFLRGKERTTFPKCQQSRGIHRNCSVRLCDKTGAVIVQELGEEVGRLTNPVFFVPKGNIKGMCWHGQYNGAKAFLLVASMLDGGDNVIGQLPSVIEPYSVPRSR